MSPELFNKWRVFPRLGMAFMSYMYYTFHMWFTQNGTLNVLQMGEWHIVGYATVLGAFIGLWKFYFETGGIGKDSTE